MKIAVLQGDGIGPEIVTVAVRVLESALSLVGANICLENVPVGLLAFADTGSTLPPSSFNAAQNADGIILGPLSTSDYPALGEGGVNASAFLRRHLDLFANLRPSRSFEGIRSAAQLDLIVVRENTEGFYAPRAMHQGTGEFAPDADTGFSLRMISARCSRRICEQAFRIAEGRRRKVTAIHKSNVLPVTDGIFLREARTVAAAFPGVVYTEELVDACASKLVEAGGEYDVLVTTNLFGDIISNEAASLAGGIGLSGSLNAGATALMAQASHGSAPDIAGKGIANPVSMTLSVALLLRELAKRRGRLDLGTASEAIIAAVRDALADETVRTPDLGGTSSTERLGERILSGLHLPLQRTHEREGE